MMKQTVGVTEARNKFGELVDQVRYRGDTVVLMKNGKPAAAIVPYELLVLLQQEREKLSTVVAQEQEHNRAIDMGEDERTALASEVIQ
jgi:prevent-host-death family protein